MKHFEHRERPIREEYKGIKETNDDIFFKRIEISKKVKSSPFDMNELEHARKSLKIGKSRDPEELVI